MQKQPVLDCLRQGKLFYFSSEGALNIQTYSDLILLAYSFFSPVAPGSCAPIIL